MKELSYLNKYFIKYKYSFSLGILITIIAQIFSLFTPKLISKSLNAIEKFDKLPKAEQTSQVVIDSYRDGLIHNVLLIIATTIVAGFLTFLMRQTLIVMSRHIEFDLKNEVFKQYENLSQNFYKQNRTGDLMNRISEDVSKVRMYVGPAVMYTINTFIRFAIVIIYMYNVSPLLTLYTILPLPILSYCIFKLSSEINKRSTTFQQYLSKVSSFSQEIFSGIRVIKANSLENQHQNNMVALADESKKKSLDLAKVQSLFGPLMIALIGISNLVVIYFGGVMYINGTIPNIGTIAEFILYVNMLTWPVASLGWVSSMVQEAEASQKRLNEFLKLEPEIKNKNENSSDIQGSIAFENVSYTYEDTNIEALKNVTFTVKKGETLAILGKTGSGKSTILSLISRLYDVTEGRITIDGNEISTLNLNDLRNNIGIVPQDAFLFSDTIKNNIKFGNQNATDKQVIEAAKNAVVHDNIAAFNKQYDTILGERGITLSGGQKQRVSIARAIIKNPAILLFDDCLSAVDTETEETILNNLFEICKDKTTIIVSHRVSSAKNADNIIILEDGRIIQQGSHNQLINQEGYYASLYLKQLSEKELL
ncbi:putative multidrug resistance ABC transporter ATP-binding/permease protein YheI [Flavobacterium bizetiae]|uniref:Putative multidrug resistance ABC transporter ATP-binding/permease protein YheI n=1 Tax=Flavobacterium bizetiae TaxID=2704140 RepID=A0A6J4GM28_9FLAO|nr:ABC transporter ATP-binding protein [Flavobacterium bizetiae]CAA9200143.1 putative multidrug resistance ABC transporter ATP-binding/permease protein YheI [Flavobacterium bizetiae]CAD5343427.1 putative multidrug resistance ABC transporter ATP-binding/permease protein YheI [Flavobacterium bizetiae]CAD5349420.1 putative multidrug resistance ABC transporter ATP-binding/permease protein YheI [Flavobacterium bizetiae]